MDEIEPSETESVNPQEDLLTDGEDGEDQKAENLVTTDDESSDFPMDNEEPPESEGPEVEQVSSLKSIGSGSGSDSSDENAEKLEDEDEMPLEFIKEPNKSLLGDWDLDDLDADPDSPDDLRSTESMLSVHISKLIITSRAEAEIIAEQVIEVLEMDVVQYLADAGISIEDWMSTENEEQNRKSLAAAPRKKISGDSISISSDISETLPGEPSKLRLHYEKGEAGPLKEIPVPPITGHGQDEGCDVALHRDRKWHRIGERPEKVDSTAQTKDMTFVPEAKAQLIFMAMYPKPDDWVPEEVPSRQTSMQLCVDAAEKEDPNIDRSRKGPQIINFTNRKKLLQPLRDDYYKDETFWTGSRFRGEYKNRQFFKGHYDHPTGVTYESEWNDGHFHSDKHLGIIKYPRGDSFEGEWRQGRHISGQITFGDGLKYQSENWSYCEAPDRRLKIEKYYGMKPAGNTIYNDTYPSPTLPPGQYDVGDGIYNPNTREVRGYDGFLLRNATPQEHDWITEHCRRAPTKEEDYVPTFHADRIPGSYMEQILKFSLAKRKFH